MNVADRNEVRIPYMVGVYLAVNAVPDLYLLTDGPDCLFFKAEYVHGAQDFHSTLLDVRGKHRVAHTLADINSVVLDREKHISELLLKLAAQDDAGMVLITAMPMASITGTQYDRIARELSAQTGRLIAEVPARSLQADWIDGYGQVLAALAREVPLKRPEASDPRRVAVIGPLIDRTEADRLADVRELTRILKDGLGLEVVSVWPANRTVAELGDAGLAGTVISLPYGTRAAKILNRRTGATLVDAPLPFGPAGTNAFVRAVAGHLGIVERGESFIASENERWGTRLELAAAGLKDRRVVVVGDPWLAEGMVGLAEYAGATVMAAQSSAFDPKPVCGLPGLRDISDFSPADLFVVPTRGIDVALRLARPFFEIGFTSYGTHAFFDAPHLGYPGAVNLLSGMVENIGLFSTLLEGGMVDLGRIANSYQVVPGTGGPDTRG